MFVRQKINHGFIVLFKNYKLIKPINSAVYDLPSPRGLSVFWNGGSLLGLILASQLATGIFLSLHYVSSVEGAFNSVDLIARERNRGSLLRMMHANGASFFFLMAFLHSGRGVYYHSYRLLRTWLVGVLMLFILMAAAFLGYVLPWGQISFWGATVITNLVSAIPRIGTRVVEWLWGGFSVDQATLTRFFSFHFLVPFLLLVLVISHLLSLHETGSSNPLGLPMMSDKILFAPYYIWKDIVGFVAVFGGLFSLISYGPWVLGDPENFIPANPLVTPVHIQPEWYFLFAYAILRSVPSKLGGVILLVLSILVLAIVCFFPKPGLRSRAWYILSRGLFWVLVSIFMLLTWVGARPVEEPFYTVGQTISGLYFVVIFAVFLVPLWTDWAFKKKISS